MRHRFGRAFLCAVLLVGAPIGCKRDAPTHGVAADDIAPGIGNARRALRNNWEQLLLDQQTKRVHPQPIERFFHLDKPPAGVTHYETLKHFYKENDWAPIFVGPNGQPNFRANALAQQARQAESHALPPEKYLRPQLAQHILRQAELRHAFAQAPIPTLSESDWSLVEQLLEEPDIKKLDKPLPVVLNRLLGQDGEPATLPELKKAWSERLQIRRAIDGGDALLELAIADAWLDWAYDMSDGYWEKVDGKANREKQETIRQNALLESMRTMAKAADRAAADAVLEAKIPTFQQYERLREQRRRYQQVVADGGWPQVRPTSLSRGSSGTVVEDLKKRLHAENFFHGTIDQRFDRELEDAVKAYQETHQMEVTGRSSAGFWSSLNVSAEDRLAQIELTMQRWRESRIGDDPYYVFINIPDFHAELWRNGVMERRMKIVVGNTKRECRNGTMTYVNATPIQTAVMDHVVLNPYWNVPQRIVNEEILPAFLENPNYFEERGYEQVTAANGAIMVRQVPGPNNALGMVKFMFPNEHDTYMHDTPRKAFFDAPTRAFSHGCMRVQDPLDLLEHILVNDENWDQNSINRIFSIGREYRMNLRTPIPVHSEYYVVRVDDEGRVHFLADLYRHDRERLDLRFVREESCTPKQRAPALRLSADGEVLQRNEAGELVNAREAAALEEEAAAAIEGGDLPMAPPGLPAGLPADMGP